MPRGKSEFKEFVDKIRTKLHHVRSNEFAAQRDVEAAEKNLLVLRAERQALEDLLPREEPPAPRKSRKKPTPEVGVVATDKQEVNR